MTSQYTNIAFISYKREDEKWAKWLQKKLEHYKLPTEIRKQNPDLEFANNPRHVFKDTTDLSGGVLAKAIKEGLDSSKFLIVICSPRAAKSEWVCKEVQDFIDSGREEYIIPFIIDGEPYAKNPEDECFPTALKILAGERELLGININENGRDMAAVKVVARLFELKFDTLWDRFQREEKKRMWWMISSFCIIAIVLLFMVVGVTQYKNELVKYKLERGVYVRVLAHDYVDIFLEPVLGVLTKADDDVHIVILLPYSYAECESKQRIREFTNFVQQDDNELGFVTISHEVIQPEGSRRDIAIKKVCFTGSDVSVYVDDVRTVSVIQKIVDYKIKYPSYFVENKDEMTQIYMDEFIEAVQGLIQDDYRHRLHFVYEREGFFQVITQLVKKDAYSD